MTTRKIYQWLLTNEPAGLTNTVIWSNLASYIYFDRVLNAGKPVDEYNEEYMAVMRKANNHHIVVPNRNHKKLAAIAGTINTKNIHEIRSALQ